MKWLALGNVRESSVLMSLIALVVASILHGSVVHGQLPTREAALDWVKRKGGIVEYEGNNPDEPVVSLRFPSRNTQILTPDQRYELHQILATMPELRELEVVCAETGEERFPKHIDQLQKLRSLNIDKSNIRLEDLRMLEKLPDLEDLRLNFCQPMDDAAMSIFGSLRGLKRLELDSYMYSGEFENDDAWLRSVQRFYEARKQGRSATPEPRFGCGGITTEHLKKLVNLRDLSQLSLACTRIDDEGARILSSFPGLTHLDVSNTSITDEGLAAISQLTELKTLRIRQCPISDEGMRHIGKLSKLEVLDCSGNWLTDKGIEPLKSCTALRELNLCRTFVTDRSVEILNGLQELQKLLAGRSRLTLEGIIHVCKSHQKMGLDAALLSFGIGPDSRAVSFQKLPWLNSNENVPEPKALSMRGNPQVTDETLASLQRHGFLSGIEFLDLSNTSITDQGLSYLQDVDTLKNLQLPGTSVTDTGLVHLRKLKALTCFPVNDTKLTLSGLLHLFMTHQSRPVEDVFETARLIRKTEEAVGSKLLDLRGLQVSDDDLKIVATMNDLDTLLLPDNAITDAGCATLAKMYELRQLWISGTSLTGRGIAKLRSAQQLQTLWVTDTKVTDSDLDTLFGMNGLMTLNLSGMTFSYAGLNRLKQLKFLETLIVDSTAMSEHDAEELRASIPGLLIIRSQKRALALVRGQERTSYHLPEGTHRIDESAGVETEVMVHPLVREFGDAHFEQAIRLSYNPTTRSALKHWRDLPTLQSVSILRAEGARAAIAMLKELPALTNLSFYGLPVRDEDFRELGVLPRLKSLSLERTQVTDGVLQYVVLSPELESLELDNTRIEGDGLQLLSQAKKLQRLDLSRAKISDEGLANLKDLKQLRVLNLYATPVDKGLRHLVGLSELRELNLSSTLVTDGTLEVLASLENLRSIDLYGTKVSEEGRRRFQEKLDKSKAK